MAVPRRNLTRDFPSFGVSKQATYDREMLDDPNQVSEMEERGNRRSQAETSAPFLPILPSMPRGIIPYTSISQGLRCRHPAPLSGMFVHDLLASCFGFP